MPEPFIKTLDFEPEKTSSTPAETLNNTSGPGTSFGLGTYDEATNSYQGGLFDPDGFDYGAAFGGEPGQYIVTPNVIDTNPGGDDDNTPYNQTSAAYKKAIDNRPELLAGSIGSDQRNAGPWPAKWSKSDWRLSPPYRDRSATIVHQQNVVLNGWKMPAANPIL